MMNVLCVCDYFLPGFKGGGPITSVANMQMQFVGKIGMSIFTRDRDLDDSEPFSNIRTNCWTETPEGAVFYASPDFFGPRGLRMALAERPADVLYFNSFFSAWASIFLLLSRFWVAPGLPILIAPRGEFSAGALSVKATKKRLFILLARISGLYRNVHWHASTDLELRDILRVFPNSGLRIHVAPNPVFTGSFTDASMAIGKKLNQINLIFVSRISPKKNLYSLLKILADVRAQVNLDIFGPIEDENYWRRCQEIVVGMPHNVNVQYRGALKPEEVSKTFARYDLFVFPTLGENFGHVIFEALRAGTPVLLSDRTPWLPDNSGAVTVLSICNVFSWCSAIEKAAKRSSQEQEDLRLAAHDYAMRYLASDVSLKANLDMFKFFSVSR